MKLERLFLYLETCWKYASLISCPCGDSPSLAGLADCLAGEALSRKDFFVGVAPSSLAALMTFWAAEDRAPV